MGLSIHYSGVLRDKKLLTLLTEEVSEISETLDWAPRIIDDKELKGISFAPERSEPVFLTFDHNNRLLSPTNNFVKEIYDGVRFDKELLFTTSVKTQYAGPDAHIAVIKLLKYVSAKYLESFTLSDEGNYWETGDEKILYAQFKKYEDALDFVQKALQDLTAVPGETASSLAERIEKILKEKFREKEE
ncbi:hypothetical protein [Agriterribacter sp.]|uniref:hypothetical protein n=1 Tax=Agriterribacter sp. TaxID=2821509 RepID=UPI002BCAB1AD|nr:hypothetical protein [Agriterribacter sp.]HRP56018.1 hypothetical protein [Agriterribacter sp.]